MRIGITVLTILLCAGNLLGQSPPKASFTKKPTALRVGDKIKIDFAVNRETDVAVFIEDANGRVVRHLVAGVLGKNPPAPLKPNTLEQTVEWDGKADWGKPAGNGPFQVRVALGMGTKYDKIVMGDPMSIGSVVGMAAGPDGTLYCVVEGGMCGPGWNGQRLVALNRDGTYQRTLIPLPANATPKQIEALGGIPVQVGGRTVPMYLDLPQHRNTAFWSSDGMAMTPDGKVLVLHPDARIGLVDVTGAEAPPSFLRPKLLPNAPTASFHTLQHRQYLAVSGDAKSAYFSGIAPKRSFSGATTPPYSAVYRVKLPERSPAEPFFGDPAKAGSDEKSLGGIAHGMAANGKGHLLICDPPNKRVVVVSEADGKFTGSFPAEAPEFVAADRETGAVYLLKLTKGGAEVVKLSGWKDPKQLAAIQLTASRSYLQWRFAADTSAKPAVLWASDGWQLFRFEDLGDKFSDARPIGGRDIGNGGFVNLTVDHFRDEPEVYVRAGRPYWWARYNEKNDKFEYLRGMNVYTDAAGACLEPGPDGNLYTQGWPQFLFKWDRQGKPLKWDTPFSTPAGVKPYAQPPNAICVHVCMTFMTHTHGIRSDGHHFLFESPFPNERGTKALYEYAPSGQRVGGPIIWKASDNVLGPRFDQAGNIYIAEQVRPADQPIPPEFAEVVGPVTLKSKWEGGDPKRTIAIMYGSILKFSPKGGMVDWEGGGRSVRRNPFEGQPKLDPSLKTVQMGSIVDTSDHTNEYFPAKVTGAEWVHFGISQLPLFYCNCQNTRFDVDPFGRVWYPDLGRYRVGVLDTNGNPITTFGSYGNAESCGPDSPVVDPQTRKVRPRKADDPRELQSPFAEPEIAFSHLIGVGATDKYAYMGDGLNRRLLRAKLVYASEETCAIK